MNSWKVILATMVIFGTGVVTGGLLVQHSQRIRAPHPQHSPARPPQAPLALSAGLVRLEFLRRAQRELDLTPAQRESIDRIIKASQERTRKITEPVAPELREELRKTKAEFWEVLTPAQRGRFEELVRQQQRPKDQRHPPAPRERPAPDGAPTNAPTPSPAS